MEQVVLSKCLSTILLIIIMSPTYGFASQKLFHELIETTDQRKITAIFDRALSGNNIQNQREALLGLGRIGDHSSTLKISPFLYSNQPDIRAMAAFALGIGNDPKAHNLLAMRIKVEKHPVVISRLLTAIGNIGDPKGAISNILPFLNQQDPDIVAAACDGLTMAWSFHRETVSIPNSTQVNRLLELVEKQGVIAEHCLYTLSRLRTDVALFDISQLQNISQQLTSIESQVLAIRIIGAMKNRVFIEQLNQLIQPENPLRIRAEAATAIALLSENISEQDQQKLRPSLQQLVADSSSLVKVNLISNLTLTTENKSLTSIVNPLLDDNSQWVRQVAIMRLFAVNGSEMGGIFLKMVNSTDFLSQQLALQILRQYEMPDNQKYIEILSLSKHKGIKSIASRLLTDEDADAEVYGKPKKTITASEAIEFAGKKLKIVTSKGTITIQLLTSAAYTSANFYQLSMSGYYDGLIFHRVIANFVAQGGDPEGTGQGGPEYSVREELYPIEHKRGTIGIATSGKDTGGSQFFFNNSDNIHLNNHYTVFARITDGLNLIDSIEVGDKILSITEVR